MMTKFRFPSIDVTLKSLANTQDGFLLQKLSLVKHTIKIPLTYLISNIIEGLEAVLSSAVL